MDANLYTGERAHPVCKAIALQIGGSHFHLEVWTSRETAALLNHENWQRVNERLAAHIEMGVRRAVLAGVWLIPGVQQAMRDEAENAAKRFAYDELKKQQRQRGIEAVQVDSLLAGEAYRV